MTPQEAALQRVSEENEQYRVGGASSASKTIILARKHLGGAMESSARLCLSDAVLLYDAGSYESARRQALRSLAYSVGVFHPDYKRCAS